MIKYKIFNSAGGMWVMLKGKQSHQRKRMMVFYVVDLLAIKFK
jgi:hypothetical protein